MRLKKTVLLIATTALFATLTTHSSMAKTAIVNTDTLKLRKEASTSSTVLELLDIGDKLEVIEEDGEWVKVKAKGITGYVSRTYVKIDGETSSAVKEEQLNKEEPSLEKTNEETSNTEETDTKTQNTATESQEIKSIENTEETVNTTTETQQNEQTTSIGVQTNGEENLINQEVVVKTDSQVSILPLINASKIASINKDEKVTIIDEVNSWCYIQTEQVSGWVRKTDLDVKVQELTVPVSAEPANTQETSNTDKPNETEQQSENTNENTSTTNNEETKTTTETKQNIEETPISERTMYVNYSSVYIRKGPGTDYDVEDSLILNDEVTVLAESGDWYKVKVGNVSGYIAKRLLSITMQSTSRNAEERILEQEEEENNTQNNEQTTTQETEHQEVATTSSIGQEIADFAQQYLGCKYVYGGSGPSTFDCSGFTMYVFKQFGVNLSHSARAQSKNGTYVAKSDLQPGDLVFFKDYETMDGIGHCGIYIGEGNFIHASSGTGYCVKISTLLSGSYNTRYETARRIF